MIKLAIIGAGSAFGGRISVDLLTRMGKDGVTIALCDINAEKLEIVHKYVQKVVDINKLTVKVESSTDRKDVLKGADYVIISVAIGGPAYFDEPFESEMKIPERYGITQTVADTVGPGGIFRALRTAPEMIKMVEDINNIAPDSMILNVTNPMAMLTWSLTKISKVPFVGLCHGVIGNAKELARLLNLPFKEVEYIAAGINHMTWFTQFKHKGKDLLPEMHNAILKVNKESKRYEFRGELVENFGYFCTESDRHFSEYVPWFQHMDRSIFKPYVERTLNIKDKRHSWYEDMGVTIDKADSFELILSHESASGIIEGIEKNKPFVFSGNVLNESYIENLPKGCCVEVPCTADGNGIHPHFVGKLPTACAALNRTNINVQELVVEAILNKNRDLAFQALLLDPITQANLSIKEARKMFDELWAKETHLLDWYYR